MKNDIKTVGWVSVVNGIIGFFIWLAIHLSNGKNPSPTPPLPSPDDNIPIVVQKEYTCEPGRTILIEPKYLGSIVWSVPPVYQNDVNVIPFPNNEKAVVNLYSDKYVYIAINGSYENKDKKFVPADVVYVKIGPKGFNPTPPEPQPPVPIPPQPTPVIPDGKYGLSKTVYVTAMKNVSSPARKAAPGLVSSYTGISAKIAAGGYNSVPNFQKAILEETTESNRQALANAKISDKEWETFFISLQDTTYQLYQDRKLVNKNDFKTAWDEIALGLEYVK